MYCRLVPSPVFNNPLCVFLQRHFIVCVVQQMLNICVCLSCSSGNCGGTCPGNSVGRKWTTSRHARAPPMPEWTAEESSVDQPFHSLARSSGADSCSLVKPYERVLRLFHSPTHGNTRRPSGFLNPGKFLLETRRNSLSSGFNPSLIMCSLCQPGYSDGNADV